MISFRSCYAVKISNGGHYFGASVVERACGWRRRNKKPAVRWQNHSSTTTNVRSGARYLATSMQALLKHLHSSVQPNDPADTQVLS